MGCSCNRPCPARFCVPHFGSIRRGKTQIGTGGGSGSSRTALCCLSQQDMAFLLSRTSLFSSFRGNSQINREHSLLPRRGFHIELGAREKALLEEDPALKKFKSHKKAVGRVKRIGDALIIVVVAACSYEIYVNGVMKRAKFEEAHHSNVKDV